MRDYPQTHAERLERAAALQEQWSRELAGYPVPDDSQTFSWLRMSDWDNETIESAFSDTSTKAEQQGFNDADHIIRFFSSRVLHYKRESRISMIQVAA